MILGNILRRIDSKSNKEKIIKTFDKLIFLNPSDITVYNMKLNYSIEINDATLTKEILNNVVDNNLIKDKAPYIQALKELNSSSNKFTFEIKLSNKIYRSLKLIPYIFFILKDKVDGPPFAVKKVSSITLGKEIKGLDLPKNVTLYIKGSENNYVDDKMLDLFESEALNLLSNTSYVVD